MLSERGCGRGVLSGLLGGRFFVGLVNNIEVFWVVGAHVGRPWDFFPLATEMAIIVFVLSQAIITIIVFPRRHCAQRVTWWLPRASVRFTH